MLLGNGSMGVVRVFVHEFLPGEDLGDLLAVADVVEAGLKLADDLLESLLGLLHEALVLVHSNI